MDFRALIRDVPDFPKPGILFRDLTPLLAHPDAIREAVEALSEPFRADGITKVVGIESRGFVFGAPVALRLGAGFVPVRKPGKLPHQKVRESYDLEYGTDALEMHADGLGAKDRVLIVDDLAATGGTLVATLALARGRGATVSACAVVVELTTLGARNRLGKTRLESLLKLP